MKAVPDRFASVGWVSWAQSRSGRMRKTTDTFLSLFLPPSLLFLSLSQERKKHREREREMKVFTSQWLALQFTRKIKASSVHFP